MSGDSPRKKRRLIPPEEGPFVLRRVLEDIPLQTESSTDPVSISCVEFWNDNLYIGTTASEILHLVCLPADAEGDPPSYILASRLEPSGHDSNTSAPDQTGVRQILVLPGALKACVLCNDTASFYTLPELTPVGNIREPTGVQWIGGIDENEGRDHPEGTVIMVAQSRRILQARVADKLRPVRNNIEYPGCLRASRRDTIACVADANGYTLLEVEHQQKIPLFPISSVPDPQPPHPPFSPPRAEVHAHSRSTSLGVLSSAAPAAATFSPPETIPERQNLEVADPARGTSPASHEEADISRPSIRPRSSTEGADTLSAPSVAKSTPLKPHILSPSPNEFMLTTGTSKSEPGVAIFVNLDGDVVRGTLDFDTYPDDVAIFSPTSDQQSDGAESEAISIVALLNTATGKVLEIQKLSDSGGESAASKARLAMSQPSTSSTLPHQRSGLACSLSPPQHVFAEVIELLRTVPYRPNQQSLKIMDSDDPRTKTSIERLEQESALFESQSNGSSSPNPEYEQKRNLEEQKFVQRFGNAASRSLVWHDSDLWLLLPNPSLLQLESTLLLQSNVIAADNYDFAHLNVSKVISFLGSIRERDAQDEAEFLALKYIKQKASVLLFQHLLVQRSTPSINLKSACTIVESALNEGEIDPRVPLLFLAPLSREVLWGSHGIWLYQGIVDCLDDAVARVAAFKDCPLEMWEMVRRYLSSWQEKRGFGSITDDRALFDSIDAALLRLLLHLDATLPRGSDAQSSVTRKLNLVVDKWKGDFDRAVTLLEHYNRLYALSRLYQSKKSFKDVLSTWKRICEGEQESDPDVNIEAVELQMRKYLTLIRDVSLVQQYGVWLAQRNSDLAVQLFADDTSRVKFVPAEVVSLLKSHAPNAVQQYLEYLVFAKHLDQYSDDLVGYYLDSVLSVLESSQEARQSLADSYSTYRALTSPKPTYLNFITENAPDEPWWRSRLRLLQLLGSGGYATTGGTGKELTYSIDMVLKRLQPHSTYLVSESIILDARQGRHHDALKLLTHGLGDFDTAVRYCYFGGPTSVSGTIDVSLLPARETQQDLFEFLLQEFLKIEDEEERMERSSHLLGTFAAWFDILEVLTSIPDDWSVQLLSEFLLRSFRAARTERNQAIILKALSAAQNLQKQADFIETCEKIGAKLETDGSANPSDTQNSAIEVS